MPGRRNWVVLAEAAAEAKMTDAEGKKPNPNSMRAVFNRVKRIKERIGAIPEQTRLNALPPQPAQSAPPSESRNAALDRMRAQFKPNNEPPRVCRRLQLPNRMEP